MATPDTQRGLYGKYRVQKIKRVRDSEGLVTHQELVDAGTCFVLSSNDPYAAIALRAYAAACAAKYPALAIDLAMLAERWAAS